MKPFPWRVVTGYALALILALALGCSKGEPPGKPPAALTAEQVQQLQQRVANLQVELGELDERLTELRREHALALAEMTTNTQAALTELALINNQLGGKPVPRPVSRQVKGAPAPDEKGPLSPLMRLLLFVVTVVAIIIIIMIFLGRLRGEEDEDDEDFTDEELAAEEGAAPVPLDVPRPETPEPAGEKTENAPSDEATKP